MRRVSPSLAISVGVHALLAVLWGVVDFAPEEPRDELGNTAVIELVDPELQTETTVDIVMIDAAALERLPELRPDVAREPVVARASKPTRAIDRPVRAAVREKTTTRDPVASQDPVAVSPLLDLRKGRDLEGRGRALLTTPSLERIALGPESTRSIVTTTNEGAIVDAKPRESVVTAEITPSGRGSYKVDDLVFKGRIAPDGSVDIKDKRDLQHQFTSWKNVKKVLLAAGPFGLLQLDFDITDAMMRRKKIDPYASRKLAFLDQTRDARVEIGRQYRKEVLARTSEIVRQNLEVMWASTVDPGARKRALFEMWDEVDETGDENVVAAGTAARAAIVGFIRSRLPQDNASAFTGSDLSMLNGRRHSRTAFAPYE